MTRVAWNKGKALGSPQLDQFAEMLAEGVHQCDAAEAMGLKRLVGHRLLQRLRKAMGEQAI